jgi:hypothetical protein
VHVSTMPNSSIGLANPPADEAFMWFPRFSNLRKYKKEKLSNLKI